MPPCCAVQARVAALLRANPEAGQAFCRYLVSSYLPQVCVCVGGGAWKAAPGRERESSRALCGRNLVPWPQRNQQ